MEIFLLAAVLIIGGYVLLTYNSLKTLQVRIKASIQEIGNQLKRQAELIPNLESSAKGYLKHEKDIFDKLTDARKAVMNAVESGSAQKMLDSQEKLNAALGSIRVVLESNPEIKGSEIVQQLMGELRDTADKIMYSRRTLIDLSADYNTKLATIPSMWIASLFSFKQEEGIKTPTSGEHLEVSSEEMKSPKVNL